MSWRRCAPRTLSGKPPSEPRSSGPPRDLRACKSVSCSQSEEARNAQRRAETTLAKVQQRNEQLIGDVQRLTADGAEQRRVAERHEKQVISVMEEARALRGERDALAQQVARLQGQLTAQTGATPVHAVKRSRKEV